MRWTNGFGGGGGGGAIGLRVGQELRVSSTGAISARGGGSPNSLENTWTSRGTSVAGGGSGGSILLQVAGSIAQLGTIDVSGGQGGIFTTSVSGIRGESRGGNGAPGFVRLESNSTAANLGVVAGLALSTNNLGSLVDTDAVTIARSKWYALPTLGTTVLRYYEMTVQIDSVLQIFTDNPLNPNPANVPGAPIRIWMQAADVDPVTRMPRGNPGAWVDNTLELGRGFPNGFRFLIVFDRTTASTISVEEFRLEYRG
jgi:hypothetical protein